LKIRIGFKKEIGGNLKEQIMGPTGKRVGKASDVKAWR
jgi:hypothetical protein